MNGDLEAAEKLLAELRDAYRSLPRHFQADVAHVLSVLARKLAASMTAEKKVTVMTRIQTASTRSSDRP